MRMLRLSNKFCLCLITMKHSFSICMLQWGECWICIFKQFMSWLEFELVEMTQYSLFTSECSGAFITSVIKIAVITITNTRYKRQQWTAFFILCCICLPWLRLKFVYIVIFCRRRGLCFGLRPFLFYLLMFLIRQNKWN